MEQHAWLLQAQLIEYNLDAVDGAINAVRAALVQGLDWKELERLIETETRAGNPVAGMVESLRLEVGRVTLLLSNDLDEEECDEEALARPATRVRMYAIYQYCTHFDRCPFQYWVGTRT